MNKILGITRKLLLLPLLLSTGACGYLFGDDGVFRDQSEDYKKAPEAAVLTVPEGKDSNALQEIYPIPPIEENLLLSGRFEVPRPTPLVAESGDDVVRIQKLGDESWALVNMAPGQLWPQVRSYITAAGLQVGSVNASAGLMDTGWVELAGQPMTSRFRFRIEQGVQRGNSELHVLQMNQAGDINSWPTVSDNLELEAEMLQAVSQFIANSSENAPVSMVADQAMSASGKISLQEAANGETFIRVGLPFNRAWASLARALDASTFNIDDRDRSGGMYYVTFLGPDAAEEDGWFDWLFDEDTHPLAGEKFLVTMSAESEQSVTIRLQRQNPALEVDEREDQALLSLIKGNIN